MSEQDWVDEAIDQFTAKIRDQRYQKCYRILEGKKSLADWKYWSKMATWTYEETALLINRIDPRGGIHNAIHAPNLLPIQDFKNDAAILKRAVDAYQMSRQDEPVKMIQAAQRLQLDVPTKLTDYVLEHAEAVLEYDERQAKREAETAVKNAEISKATSERIERAYSTASVTRKNSEAKDKEHRAEQQEGERKLENVYRVTGLLLKILKEKKFTQKGLMGAIQTYYDPDAPENANKGLKDRTIEDVFSESNKALKRLLEPEDDF